MSIVKADGIGLVLGGKEILRDVSLAVEHGEFFVVIGPNGSGKTSLLRVLANLLAPRSGMVTVMGKPLAEFSRRALARQVAVVPQHVALDFPFTVKETVLMGRSPHLGLLGFEQQHDYQVAEDAMRFTDVLHLADRTLDRLSGGELQRVIIARALCQEPQIILLDEPTAALDLAHQVHIMDLLEKFRKDKGVTVIMVSHDLNLAAMYGDRLLLLKDGAVVMVGTPEEVLKFELLEQSYGCVMLVDRCPLADIPRVIPVPGKYLAK